MRDKCIEMMVITKDTFNFNFNIPLLVNWKIPLFDVAEHEIDYPNLLEQNRGIRMCNGRY